jgi:hypothetical protein
MVGGDPGRVHLGWQYALCQPDPGPPPPRPAPAPVVKLDPGWLAAQRRVEAMLARPAWLGAATCALAAAACAGLWLAGLVPVALAACGTAVALAGTARGARSALAGRRRLGATIAAERRRVAAISAADRQRLAIRQAEHAVRFRAWQQHKTAFERQPHWFTVHLPADIDRVDIAGGTLAGWSALLTTIAAPRLSAGGEVTVVDMTEGAAAADLVTLAERSGVRPLVWVLPRDLPRLDLGAGLGTQALANVLALAVNSSADVSRVADLAADCALLERVIGVLAPDPGISRVTAALRVLADVGDPLADLRSGLITAAELEAVGTLYGRGAAERVVIERAWALESRLRRLDQLGTDQVSLPPSRLRVVSLDRRAGVVGNRMSGTYLTAALTHMLRQASPGRPWEHVLCLLGAERLSGDVIDLLVDACELARTGLVIGYRAIAGDVAARLGRGNAAVAFMRLGNGADAKTASELIGTEHKFVVGQLTDTVGTSFTDTWADSYTSSTGTSGTVGGSYSASQSLGGSRGRGTSRQGGFAPFGAFTGSSSAGTNYSLGETGSISWTEGVSTGTSWGLSLSRAVGENSSLGRTAQRSREFLVEPSELQRLPSSAVIVSYPSAAGRVVVLADANPAIVTLPEASQRSLDEVKAGYGQDSWPISEQVRTRYSAGHLPRQAEPGPRAVNLGPPPERLDWRRRR